MEENENTPGDSPTSGFIRKSQSFADFLRTKLPSDDFRSAIFYILIAIVVSSTTVYSASLDSCLDIPRSLIFLVLITVISGFLLLFYYLYALDIRLFKGPISFATLIFVVSLALSVVFSRDQGISFLGSYLRHMGFLQFSGAAFLFFVGIFIFNNARRLEKLLYVISLLGLLHASYGILQTFGVDFLGLDTSVKSVFNIRPIGFSGNADYFGMLIVILAFPTISLFCISIMRKNITAAIFSGFSFFVQFSAIVASMTRSSWIAFFVGFTVLSFFILQYFRKKNLRMAIYSLSLAVSVFIVSISVIIFFVPKFKASVGKKVLSIFSLSQKDEYSSLGQNIPTERPILWKDSLKFCMSELKAGHYSGVGLDNFAKYFLPFASKELRQVTLNKNYDIPHNVPLSYFATAGIIGLSAYILLILSVIYVSLTSLFRWKGSPDSYFIFFGFASAIAAYFVNSFFFSDNIGSITLFFLFSSALVVSARQKEIEPQEHKGITSHIIRAALYILTAATLALALMGGEDYSRRMLADLHFKNGLNYYIGPKKPEKDSLDNAISEFKKAGITYPRETYYTQTMITAMTWKVEGFMSKDDNKSAGAIYTEALDYAEQIEKRSWNPDELFLNLSVMTFYIGMLGDSVNVAEQSLQLNKWSIAGRFFLANEYITIYNLTKDMKSLSLAFVNAVITADLLKYFPYTKPEYFSFAIDTGMELYEKNNDNAVFKKLTDLFSIYVTIAIVSDESRKTVDKMLDLSKNKTGYDNVMASSLIYDLRSRKIGLDQALSNIDSLKNIDPQNKTIFIEKLKKMK